MTRRRGTGTDRSRMGVQLHVLEAQAPSEFERAFAAMPGARPQALMVLTDIMFITHRSRIVQMAAKSRLPADLPIEQPTRFELIINRASYRPWCWVRQVRVLGLVLRVHGGEGLRGQRHAVTRPGADGGALTKTSRTRVVGWALAAAACLVGLIVLGSYLSESTRIPGESQRDRHQRESERVRDAIQEAGATCSRDFAGRIDLYAECLARLTSMIPPARY